MDKTKENAGKGSQRGGNFKDDPERASEAGRKGGQASQTGSKSASSDDKRKQQSGGKR